MKIDAGLIFDNLREVPEAARRAEEIGFDGVWTAEAKHEALLPLSLVAEHTQRLQLGSGIAVAFARSPMILAHMAWDLAAQSQGRFILGLGTQVKAHVERRFGMPWDAPVPKLREMILALRATWDCWQNGSRLNFRGQYYKLTLMSPFFNPGPIPTPHVPIFIAGVNTLMCHLAGELADGFHVHPFHTARYLREVTLPAIVEGCQRAGRARKDLEVVSAVFVITSAAQREMAREQLSFYASTPSYRRVLDCHGWGETGDRLSHLAARQRWQEMARLIDDDMLEEFAIVGEPSEIPEKLHAKYHGLLDRIWLYEPFLPGKDDAFWQAMVQGMRECSG